MSRPYDVDVPRELGADWRRPMGMRRALAVVTMAALAAAPAALAEPAIGSRSAGDGWVVEVPVEPSDMGPIAVFVGRVRPAGEGDGGPWLQHDIVFENHGDRRVTFADTRTARLLGAPGRPVLLVSDNACGYHRVEPLVGSCLLYLDFPTVKPGRSITRTITLWKGLRGMKPLTPGTYVFRKPVRFKVGREVPAKGAGRTFRLRVVYRVDVG